MIIKFKNKDFRLSDWVEIENKNYFSKSSDFARYLTFGNKKLRDDFCHLDCYFKPFVISFYGQLEFLNEVYLKMFNSFDLDVNFTTNDAKNHIDDFLINKLKLIPFI